MRNIYTLLLLLLICLTSSQAQESHLQNIQQLTFGGDNAEAYFSPDGSKLVMQVTNPEIGAECDQIYILELNKDNYSTSDLQLVSTGKGRTTCAFFMPDGEHIIYASTHAADDACPPKPAPRADGKYVWPIYDSFDIYKANLKGEIVEQYTNTPGYDAEAVVSPDGKYIAFTSTRNGDLDIYLMDIDGTNVRQITDGLGYDGGAFFTHDSKQLIFRSSRPQTAEDIAEYKQLLKENLVTPTEMELYMVNIDGSNLRKITDLGKANWSPYMHPTDDRIIFSSNHHSTRGYDFQLYSVDTTGKNVEQITYQSQFNAFPMFSPDGKKIAFSSNRGIAKDRETNVFIADWLPGKTTQLPNDKELKNTIQFLAHDKLEGRLAGSKGEKLAARYIKNKLKLLNLAPYFGKSYTDKFDYNVKLNPHSSTEITKSKGTNVAAFLDNKADKTIVIGAHYDHLGRNEHHQSTLANSDNLIHNGADDNASGVAAVLEMARMLSTNDVKEDANYVFAFFSGEEDGLIGSKEIANELTEKQNVVAMINLDMVGRLNKDKELTVGGVGTSPSLQTIIEQYKPAGFNTAVDSSGVGPSDHTSFYLKDIPVLFFFTGTHEDYHKPSDDADKINYTGLSNIVQYVYGVAQELALQSELPFQQTKTSSQKAVPDYKVTLGIMPSYAETTNGLKVDGVIEDRPGFKAGLQQGDIITKIGDCEVSDIYGYMDCLSKFQPGQTTTIEFFRGDEEISNKVTF